MNTPHMLRPLHCQDNEDRPLCCLFCELDWDLVLAQDAHCYAWKCFRPVTERHTLIIPKRHVSDYLDLYQSESNAIQRMTKRVQQDIGVNDESVIGFKSGLADNYRTTDPQFFHVHAYVIPIRDADVDHPVGGCGITENKNSELYEPPSIRVQ